MPDPALSLRVLPETLTVARLDENDAIPDWAFGGPGVAAIVRRSGELSVVCASDRVPANILAETGWRALEVAGPLDFSLVGILAALADPLAAAAISIFALSTYDTDVLLVRGDRLTDAVAALQAAGHTVSRFS